MRWLRVAAVAMFAFSALIGAAATYSVFGESSPPFAIPRARAATGTDTYQLSSFEVQYPYDSPATGDSADTTLAGITFNASWSGTKFPGAAQCEVVLKDSAGDVVGQAAFTGVYVPTTGEAPLLPVAVTGQPASVEGSCEPGSYPSGDGYTFDEMRVARAPVGREDFSTITLTAHWASGVDPIVRDCEFHVSLVSGETLTFYGGVSVPDGADVSFDAPSPPEQIDTASISCSEV